MEICVVYGKTAQVSHFPSNRLLICLLFVSAELIWIKFGRTIPKVIAKDAATSMQWIKADLEIQTNLKGLFSNWMDPALLILLQDTLLPFSYASWYQ